MTKVAYRTEESPHGGTTKNYTGTRTELLAAIKEQPKKTRFSVFVNHEIIRVDVLGQPLPTGRRLRLTIVKITKAEALTVAADTLTDVQEAEHFQTGWRIHEDEGYRSFSLLDF